MEIQIEEILKHLEVEVGAKSREIAILKATNSALQATVDELTKENQSLKAAPADL